MKTTICPWSSGEKQLRRTSPPAPSSSAHRLDEKFSFYGDFPTFSFRFRVFFDSQKLYPFQHAWHNLSAGPMTLAVCIGFLFCFHFLWFADHFDCSISVLLRTQTHSQCQFRNNFDTIFFTTQHSHRAAIESRTHLLNAFCHITEPLSDILLSNIKISAIKINKQETSDWKIAKRIMRIEQRDKNICRRVRLVLLSLFWATLAHFLFRDR